MKKDFWGLIGVRLLINLSDSLFYIITLWYVSEISPLLSGIVVSLFVLPENFNIFIGPIIDRYNPSKILKKVLWFEVIVMILFVIGVDYKLVNNYLLLATILIFATLSSMTYPIEETMVPFIVEKENLVKANSILIASYNIIDTIFNSATGIMLSIFTIAMLYKINLVIMIIPLILIHLVKFSSDFKTENSDDEENYTFKQYKYELIDGVKLFRKGIIFDLVVPTIFLNFFFNMCTVAMPFIAKKYVNPEITFGIILGICGFAQFTGILLSNILNKYFNAGKSIALGFLIKGVTWIIMLSFSEYKYVFYTLLFINYMFLGAVNIIFGSLFQSLIPKEYLGRANSTFDTILTICMPLGAFISGVVLKIGVSPEFVMLPYGLCVLFAALYYTKVKTIYNAKLTNEE